MPPVHKMVVHKYIPDKLFGFAIDPFTGRQAFFHLGAFIPGRSEERQGCPQCPGHGCSWVSAPPPPILGEEVLVEVDLEGGEDGRAPRATRVERLTKPLALIGQVDTFDPHRGFGFITGGDGESYHLHNSEVIDRRIPVTGQTVVFFGGVRQGRPRACHVKVCS